MTAIVRSGVKTVRFSEVRADAVRVGHVLPPGVVTAVDVNTIDDEVRFETAGRSVHFASSAESVTVLGIVDREHMPYLLDALAEVTR